MSDLSELNSLFGKMEQGKLYIVYHEQLYDDPKFIGIARDSADLMRLVCQYHKQHFSFYKRAADMMKEITFSIRETTYGVPFDV